MESDFGFHGSLIFLIAPLLIRVKWDTLVIKAGYEIPHGIHTWVTAGMYLVISLPIWWWGPERFLFQPFLFGGAIFAFSFDYLLNIARHLKLIYVDQGTDGISSKTDAFYKNMDWWIILFFKLIVLLFGFSFEFYWSHIWTF